jgi:hypothetical protein
MKSTLAFLVSTLALHAAEPQTVLVLPVRVHLMQSTNQTKMHTTLTEADVERIFGKVNRIWSQAGIRFEVESVRKTQAVEISAEAKFETQFDRVKAGIPKECLSATALNVCYVKEIAPNGFHYGEPTVVKDTAKLKEVPGGIDEPIPRVTSHEFGHALGLPHRQNVTNLMASGTTGFSLNETEIETARTRATKFQATATKRDAK